jgi:hypothetical protein
VVDTNSRRDIKITGTHDLVHIGERNSEVGVAFSRACLRRTGSKVKSAPTEAWILWELRWCHVDVGAVGGESSDGSWMDLDHDSMIQWFMDGEVVTTDKVNLIVYTRTTKTKMDGPPENSNAEEFCQLCLKVFNYLCYMFYFHARFFSLF